MKNFFQKYRVIFLLVIAFFLIARMQGGEQLLTKYSLLGQEFLPGWQEAERWYVLLQKTLPAPLENQKTLPSELFTVTEIIDGDTVKGIYHGKEETVRLIGVNAPETGGPYRKKECFGEEAKKRLGEILPQKSEALFSADSSQAERDRYQRLLGYIMFSGNDVAEQMIEEGFAHEYTYKHSYQKQKQFQAAEKEAHENHRGLWEESKKCNL